MEKLKRKSFVMQKENKKIEREIKYIFSNALNVTRFMDNNTETFS